MKFLIVAAVKEELSLLLKEFDAGPEAHEGFYSLYLGRADGCSLGFGVIGVGLASAALALGGLLSVQTPEAIVLVGSAGALPGSGLEKGDVVVARSEILAELGLLAGPGIGDAGSLGLPNLVQEIALDKTLADEIVSAAGPAPSVCYARLLTVVGVSADRDQAGARARRFRAAAENMEGYAAALAGRSLGIRTAEVRGISNRAGDRDKTNWGLNLANERAQRAVTGYLRGVF